MAGDPLPPRDERPTERIVPDEQPTVRGLAAGQLKFGRYVLEAVAGRGGMGVVWRARDEKLERTVALKFLPPEVAADPEAVRDLKRETKRCLELTHPQIVRVYDLVEAAPDAAIAMEYVDGESLARRKAAAPGGCLNVAELAPWAAQLCAALDYAHLTAKVVHRDLKPGNLLVTAEGQLKVTDFGIARSLSETRTRLTGTAGGTSGTLLYMSPQQLLNRPHAPADDIYSLGATLYELLTGKPPFYGGDVFNLVQHVAPAPLTERRAELGNSGEPIPSPWEKTILACLAKEPRDRPQSASEVAERLGLGTKGTRGTKIEAGAVDPGRHGFGESGSIRPGPSGKSRRSLYAGIVGAAILAAAAVFFWPKAGVGRGVPSATLKSEPVHPASNPAETPAGAAAPSILPREFTVTVDPADAAARVWLGPLSDVPVTAGSAVLKDLPDGEQDLIVQAPGYQPYSTRVTVKDGRGSVGARLVPVRGAVEITARPGTLVTALDARGKATRLGTVAAAGTLLVDNLLTVGFYTLRFEHPDLAPAEQRDVELVIGRTIKVAPVQTPLPGELRVFSVPSGAEVRVNGAVAGATPATLKNQPSEQPLAIVVSQRGYRRVEQSVTLKPKEVRTINLGTLTAEAGGIVLRISNPAFSLAQAAIAIDGKPIEVARGVPSAPSAENGVNVLPIDGLEVGVRSVAVTHPDYEPWTQSVTVRDQQATPVEVRLQPKPGRLSLRIAGPTEVEFFVNGEAVGGERFKDGTVELPAQQKLALEIKAQGYKTAARTLTLPANGAETWSAVLEKLRGPEPGQPWTVPELGLVMQPIAPGTFTMGSTNGDADEKPQTRVTLTQSYWLGRTEVTQREWQAVMGSNPSNFKGDDRPVEQVSWDEAMEFCRKLTERERTAGRLPAGWAYTLPTEAQWEYACRAGTTGDYAGSLDAMGWYGQNSGNQTHPVGQKQANAWGLADMHGNVWEWCADWYGDYPGGSVTDPTGPPSGSYRVHRGGCWGNNATYCRSARRNGNGPGNRRLNLGFRLALSSVQ